MSTNITHAEFLSGELRIRARDVRLLLGYLELPETNLLKELQRAACRAGSEDELPVSDSHFWSGTSSGNLFDTLVEKIAPCFLGRADVVFYWEDGSPDGWRFEDGKAIACEVQQVLVPIPAKKSG